jgi:hypothetical protein
VELFLLAQEHQDKVVLVELLTLVTVMQVAVVVVLAA